MGFFDIFTRTAEPVEQRMASSAILPPSRNTEDTSVSAGKAFSLPAVYRAISTLSISAKQMSIETVRDNKVVTSTPLIKKPNVDMSRSSFIEQTVVSLASQGNAYWLIEKDTTGKVINLTPLNPLDMQIETTKTGKIKVYKYQGNDYRPDQIKHMALLQIPGNAKGLGPIQAAQAELYGTIQTRDYANTWFDKSGVPGGILTTNSLLNPEDVETVKTTWTKTAGAKNGVAVVGNGFTYQAVYLKPEELQFLGVQQFSITQIARLFGVPASLMLAANEGTTMTYANVSQEWLGFVRFSLMQYLIIIEDALSDFLPGNQRAKFNIEAILRADTTTRYAAHASALQAGWMTKNEVRQIEDMPERPEFESNNVESDPAPVVEPGNNDNQGDTNV